jgi:hypothetical protein
MFRHLLVIIRCTPCAYVLNLFFNTDAYFKYNYTECLDEGYPNKQFISRKLSYTYTVYVFGKVNPESFFFPCPTYAHVPAGDRRRAQ